MDEKAHADDTATRFAQAAGFHWVLKQLGGYEDIVPLHITVAATRDGEHRHAGTVLLTVEEAGDLYRLLKAGCQATGYKSQVELAESPRR